MNAQRKDDGRPLSDLHICAQAFTFVLAGKRYKRHQDAVVSYACPMHSHTHLVATINNKLLNTRP